MGTAIGNAPLSHFCNFSFPARNLPCINPWRRRSFCALGLLEVALKYVDGENPILLFIHMHYILFCARGGVFYIFFTKEALSRASISMFARYFQE